MKRILLILMVASLCACGCKNSKNVVVEQKKDEAGATYTTKPASLTETKWMLTHLNAVPVTDSPERPYIIFTGDRVTGSLGCNTFFGSFYANKKGKIDIEYTGSTKKLCDQMDVEYKFISAMKSENMSYVLKEDLLFIYGERMDSDGVKKNIEIMRFKAEK